jgi:hypothetical protein
MELIKMVTEVVSINKIEISNECTIFSNKTRMTYPIVNELEKEVKSLRKELKEKGVSLGKTDTLKMLKEQKELYNSMVKKYNQLFDQLVVAWANKIHIGIYTGYSDDEYLNDVIRPLEHSLTEMNYRHTLISQMLELDMRVKEIKRDLELGANYEKVYI